MPDEPPPGETPPADGAPVEEPPAEDPPADGAPVEEPPSEEEPPAETAPVEELPSEEPGAPIPPSDGDDTFEVIFCEDAENTCGLDVPEGYFCEAVYDGAREAGETPLYYQCDDNNELVEGPNGEACFDVLVYGGPDDKGTPGYDCQDKGGGCLYDADWNEVRCASPHQPPDDYDGMCGEDKCGLDVPPNYDCYDESEAYGDGAYTCYDPDQVTSPSGESCDKSVIFRGGDSRGEVRYFCGEGYPYEMNGKEYCGDYDANFRPIECTPGGKGGTDHGWKDSKEATEVLADTRRNRPDGRSGGIPDSGSDDGASPVGRGGGSEGSEPSAGGAEGDPADTDSGAGSDAPDGVAPSGDSAGAGSPSSAPGPAPRGAAERGDDSGAGAGDPRAPEAPVNAAPVARAEREAGVGGENAGAPAGEAAILASLDRTNAATEPAVSEGDAGAPDGEAEPSPGEAAILASLDRTSAATEPAVSEGDASAAEARSVGAAVPDARDRLADAGGAADDPETPIDSAVLPVGQDDPPVDGVSPATSSPNDYGYVDREAVRFVAFTKIPGGAGVDPREAEARGQGTPEGRPQDGEEGTAAALDPASSLSTVALAALIGTGAVMVAGATRLRGVRR